MDNKKRISVKVTISATLIIAMIIAAYVVGTHYAKENAKLDMKTISQVIKSENDLVTVSDTISAETTYTTVKKFIIKLPFTKNKEQISFQGIVKAGYNLGKATVTSDEANKTIHVELPKMKIIAKDVDEKSFKHNSIKRALLNWKDMDYTVDLMGKLEDRLVETAKQNSEFRAKALKNAEDNIKDLFKKANVANGYTVVCTEV